jgi:hypothetical protein
MLSASYDAFVPSNVSAFATLPNFASAPPYVPFDQINQILQPLDEKYNITRAYVAEVNSPSILNHNLRVISYAFGLLQAGFPSQSSPTAPQITTEELTEQLYLAGILHDTGLTRDKKTLKNPAHTMTFEVFGALLAYEHLHTVKYPSTNDQFIGVVTQSIVFHSSSFGVGNSSAALALLHLGAFLDVGGWDAFGPGLFRTLWNNQTVADIEKAFPRLDVSDEIADDIEEMLKDKPDCVLNHYVSYISSFFDKNADSSFIATRP